MKKDRKLSQLEAIRWLDSHAVYGNEWQGAGLWEAVTTILATGPRLLTEDYVNILLQRATER